MSVCCLKRAIGTERRAETIWDARGTLSWERLLPAKQCKRDQNSLAVCSSFIKRRHFACITSAAPRTLFSEAALAGIHAAAFANQLLAGSTTLESRVCEHTSFSHVSACVCGYDVSFWAHYSHNAGLALAACMRLWIVCVGLLGFGAWQCCSAHIKEPSPPGPVTRRPCRPLAFAQGHAKLNKSIFTAHRLWITCTCVSIYSAAIDQCCRYTYIAFIASFQQHWMCQVNWILPCASVMFQTW